MHLYIFFICLNIIYQVISSPTCRENSNLCSYCNKLTNLCSKCEKPDILVPDEKGGCTGVKKCFLGKNFCKECDIDGKICKECEVNYFPDNNGGCTYTEGCEISFFGECLKCLSNFALIGNKNDIRICKYLLIDDFKNCLEINYKTGFCNICEEGYYLTSADYKCIKTENCKESLLGICTSCNEGYYYNKIDNKCKLQNENLKYCKQVIDGNKCETCQDNFYLDEKGICTNSQFCLESKNSKCTKCSNGYYLSNNNICTKTDNCYNADKILALCIYCKEEFYLDLEDFKCKSNLEDELFKYCQKAENGKCIKCIQNYYIGEDSKCSNSFDCIESKNGICIACRNGYHLGLDNICTNIERCIYTRLDSCFECEDGYYFNKLNKTCLEMKDQFLNCRFSCDFEDKCCECKNNFYLFGNDSLCYDNTKEESFKKCSFVDGLNKTCNKCEEGYFLGEQNKKCSKVEKCKIVENEDKCFECQKFYCLDVKNQGCVYYNYLNNINNKFLISCNRTNAEGKACEKCINGYELNEYGNCIDIDICENKKDGKCLKCKDIISENNIHFCANEIFGCLETIDENCLRCDNFENIYECTECKEGYQKKGSFCLK